MRLHWYAGWLIDDADILVHEKDCGCPVCTVGCRVSLRSGMHSEPLPLHDINPAESLLGLHV